MTSSVLSILDPLDRLSDRERQEAVAEVLRRTAAEPLPPLDDEALVEVASTTFRELDDREKADGRP